MIRLCDVISVMENLFSCLVYESDFIEIENDIEEVRKYYLNDEDNGFDMYSIISICKEGKSEGRIIIYDKEMYEVESRDIIIINDVVYISSCKVE